MPLASLVKLSELKTYIEINEDNSTFDNSLMQLARVATKSLENFCRRSFSEQIFTEIFNTRNAQSFYYDLSSDYSNIDGYLASTKAQRFPLKGFPVNTSLDFDVYYDTTRVFAADTKLESTDYYLNAAGNTLYLLKATTEAYMSLKIVYTGGYTTTTSGNEITISGAPENLKLACVTQVMFMFNKYQQANVGVKGSKKHSPEFVQNEQMLCPEAQALAFEFRQNLMGKR